MWMLLVLPLLLPSAAAETGSISKIEALTERRGNTWHIHSRYSGNQHSKKAGYDRIASLAAGYWRNKENPKKEHGNLAGADDSHSHSRCLTTRNFVDATKPGPLGASACVENGNNIANNQNGSNSSSLIKIIINNRKTTFVAADKDDTVAKVVEQKRNIVFSGNVLSKEKQGYHYLTHEARHFQNQSLLRHGMFSAVSQQDGINETVSPDRYVMKKNDSGEEAASNSNSRDEDGSGDGGPGPDLRHPESYWYFITFVILMVLCFTVLPVIMILLSRRRQRVFHIKSGLAAASGSRDML